MITLRHKTNKSLVILLLFLSGCSSSEDTSGSQEESGRDAGAISGCKSDSECEPVDCVCPDGSQLAVQACYILNQKGTCADSVNCSYPLFGFCDSATDGGMEDNSSGDVAGDNDAGYVDDTSGGGGDTGDSGEDAEPSDVSSGDAGGGSTDGGTGRFCGRVSVCGKGITCNISSGKCEARSQSKGSTPRIVSAYPTLAAPGDYLVVDGEGFYTTLLPDMNAYISVGGMECTAMLLDESRVAAILPQGANGAIEFSGKSGIATFNVTISASLVPGAEEVCTATDPPATGKEPADPADIGPYGAGYTDNDEIDSTTRVFYPAKCGGLRKPPAEGKFPFVMILHGDGAGHINYDYLGRHLASWGYIVANPPSVEPGILVNVLEAGLNSPEQFFTSLQGKSLGGKAVIIGHSMGSTRTGDIFSSGEKRIHGVIFLGPVSQNLNYPVPGMVFGATLDMQSSDGNYNGVYNVIEKPKYRIILNGGNHSQFTDDKHWEYSGIMSDKVATMDRNRQFEIVQSFVLAQVQRFFGQEELFSNLLEAPNFGSEIEFSSDL